MSFQPTAVCPEHSDYRGRRQPEGPRHHCSDCNRIHQERKAFEDAKVEKMLRRFDQHEAATPGKLWVIYDERAILGGTDDAAVLESCGSLQDVRRSTWDGHRDPLGAVYEYDVVPKDGQNWLENERFIGTVPGVKAKP